jgi:hypothetical protein
MPLSDLSLANWYGASQPRTPRNMRYTEENNNSPATLIRDILKPYDANQMRPYPVSMKLNNSKNDDAESASPAILDTPTQAKLF